ncbi:coA-transferase III family protein [Burkholderia thailandensis]|uniref:CoA-transferase III family protein n=1 Tax=Burkholderia thailandensis TaxID=57975 RepID=A0AAW9CZ24_BURTH|nr:coA-transferase III family protein [Burkholderia thailandensis]MDW9256148.1 coA-transferase III family protein [Burkholderia thailandensis]
MASRGRRPGRARTRELDGGDPCLPSADRIGALAGASNAAAALAAAECDRMRTGRARRVRVSVRHAPMLLATPPRCPSGPVPSNHDAPRRLP